MMQRLGHVLYWIGNIIAGLAILGGGVMAVTMARSANASDITAAPYVGGAIALSAIIPWGIGRACRYVLSDQ